MMNGLFSLTAARVARNEFGHIVVEVKQKSVAEAARKRAQSGTPAGILAAAKTAVVASQGKGYRNCKKYYFPVIAQSGSQ